MVESFYQESGVSAIDAQILERFTRPFISNDEEQRLLQVRGEVVPSQRVGLVIGRFQPLHYGHIYLFKQALAIAHAIIIGVGSANVKNQDNPFSVSFREGMVRQAIQQHDFAQRVLGVVQLNDYQDDRFWLEETLKKTGDIDVVIGNNEWVNGIFSKANVATREVPLLNRGGYEGTKIRQWLRSSGLLGDTAQ